MGRAEPSRNCRVRSAPRCAARSRRRQTSRSAAFHQGRAARRVASHAPDPRIVGPAGWGANCRPRTSRHANGRVARLHRRVEGRGKHVIALQRRAVLEDLLDRRPVREWFEHIRDADALGSDAGATAAPCGLDRDAVRLGHVHASAAAVPHTAPGHGRASFGAHEHRAVSSRRRRATAARVRTRARAPSCGRRRLRCVARGARGSRGCAAG